MTLSYVAAVVLQAVASGFPYGFDIMDASGLPGGTVYPALRRLERAGFVRSKWESEDIARKAKRPRRRYYSVTEEGDRALQGALERFPLLRQPLPDATVPAKAEES
jgi:DNA-binding PadR family transcriptional regulator